MMHVLIAGVSTRAAAESAARAGFAVTAIDAFADLDQHPSVRALSVPRDLGVRFSATAAARLPQTIGAEAVAYLSPFENHPRAIHTMSRGRELWGNSPAALGRVRDPFVVTATLKRHRFAVPWIGGARGDPAGRGNYIVKPRASGGGRGVSSWTPGATLPRGSFLQQRIDGVAGSIVFVAARGTAVPIGCSRQLIGLAAFGASGYRYCGNIMSSATDPQFEREDRLLDAARAMTDVVASEFSLTGVNGIDFIAFDGVPFPIEVNPRWCASMELVERTHGFSVFGAHATACSHGRLPAFDLSRARRRGGATGKAIVFARHAVIVGDTRTWLDRSDIRDIPRAGDRVRSGEPICTVFAEAADAASCERALIARAAQVYADVERWGAPSPEPVLTGSPPSALRASRLGASTAQSARRLR